MAGGPAGVGAANPYAGYAPIMFILMTRNIATDGYVFRDAWNDNLFSRPGCIIASPSFNENCPNIDQDYIYSWTRDAAITAFELASAPVPLDQVAYLGQYLENYLTFAKICQDSCLANNVPIDHAAYNIDGTPRPNWGNQSDGPASQTSAILGILAKYGAQVAAQAAADGRTAITRNLDFLLRNDEYRRPTLNLWEETSGLSFYTRAVQLRCFREISQTLAADNPLGIALPSGITAANVDAAKSWLTQELRNHWMANNGIYQSILQSSGKGWDLNADIVMAAVYGDVPDGLADSKLLSTAAQVRAYFAEHFPVNQDVAHGPMIGRYPNDSYCGGHAWMLCTANFAEFYYRLAATISANPGLFAVDALTAVFYQQVGATAATPANSIPDLLRIAGDRMMDGVIYHSDHLELSEQVDRNNGYEESVRDLTWSYAAFMSAARAR
jgi:glucoamylase